MKGYKGFNSDMTCRGFQYEEGKVYECEEAKICESGFHYCHNPLDVLDYYPLVNDNGKENVYAEVEPLEEEKTDDGRKFCTKKIKIGARLKLKDLINASVEFISESCKEAKDEKIQASSGNYAKLASSGNYAKLASRGNCAKLASSGDCAQLASSGNYAKLASSGNYAQLASSGDYAKLASSGNYAKLASSGDYAKLASDGIYAVCANIGIDGMTRAKLGSYIVLAEYEEVYDEELGHYVNKPIAVKSHKVDGKTVKPDTWYTLKDGKFTEVKMELLK